NTLLQLYFESAIEEEANEQPFVALETRNQRDRVWTEWTEYVFSSPSPFPGLPPSRELKLDTTRLDVDPCRFWVDFAREPSAPRGQAIVQGFLHKYVENSY
ncbi:hypothetical protein N657DRAFT_549723, partial [Parathielavia appendiculata]